MLGYKERFAWRLIGDGDRVLTVVLDNIYCEAREYRVRII
jgi:hypothetical protein